MNSTRPASAAACATASPSTSASNGARSRLGHQAGQPRHLRPVGPRRSGRRVRVPTRARSSKLAQRPANEDWLDHSARRKAIVSPPIGGRPHRPARGGTSSSRPRGRRLAGPCAQAEAEPAARQRLQRRGRGGDVRSRAGRDVGDQRSQLHPLGHRGDGAERRPHLQAWSAPAPRRTGGRSTRPSRTRPPRPPGCSSSSGPSHPAGFSERPVVTVRSSAPREAADGQWGGHGDDDHAPQQRGRDVWPCSGAAPPCRRHRATASGWCRPSP